MGVLFAGYSKGEQDQKNPATNVETTAPAPNETPPAAAPEKAAEAPAPVPAASAAVQKVQAKDKAGDDFVTFYEQQQQYRKSGEKSEAADREFDSKWKALTEGMKPRTVINGLDFLAVSTKATGDKEYTFSFLFRATANLETNYHLNICGTVCSYNAHYLAEDLRQGLYVQWNCYLKEEPTSQWKQGEYRVVQLKVESELVPYSLRLDLVTRGEQLEYTGLVGQLYLGWQWDVRDEKAFISRIEACNDFATLHALAPAGPLISAPVAQALEAKWKALTATMHPQTMIKGLDYLDILTKATGENEYTFSFLLRSTADLDTDYHLSITGKVDPSFRQYIKPAKPQASYTTWALPLYTDPTSQWKAGEYHVAQLRVETKIIPYNLSVLLQTRNAQDKWTGNPGNKIEIGWQADISE
jgi:hypothetical protein